MRFAKNKILTALLISILFICGISGKVEAAYSATSQTVNSGDSVSITIKSTDKLENFDIECTDVGGLTYKSCSSSVTGAVVNSAGKKISYAVIGGEATTLGTYTFTAPEVTEQKNYTVKFDVNGEIVSATITVKAKETKPEEKPTEPEKPTTPTTPEKPEEQPKEKSTNAYLSTLGITPKEYDFSGFKKTNLNYSVTIPYEVDELKVLYKTADSNAKVKVTGNSGFVVGSNNKITVKVTAEDGKTTKTYTIKVTKLAEVEEKPGNIIDEENEENKGVFLTFLELDGIEISPEFKKDTYSYTATLTEDVSEIKVNATANKENATIDISGNTNLVVGENTINIVVKQNDSSVQTIYQINLTKELVTEIVDSTTEEKDSNIMGNLIGAFNKYVIIAVAVVILMVVVVIVLIVLLRKENKKLKNEEEYEETNEYNVYENDENEFKNNIEETKEVVEEDQSVEKTSNETETKNKRKRTRKEKGRHAK